MSLVEYKDACGDEHVNKFESRNTARTIANMCEIKKFI